MDVHLSDCARNNEPAYPNGPCTCLPARLVKFAQDSYIDHENLYGDVLIEAADSISHLQADNALLKLHAQQTGEEFEQALFTRLEQIEALQEQNRVLTDANALLQQKGIEEYQRGFTEGESKQAILELRGRDGFIEKVIKPENEALKQDNARLREQLAAVTRERDGWKETALMENQNANHWRNSDTDLRAERDAALARISVLEAAIDSPMGWMAGESLNPEQLTWLRNLRQVRGARP